MKVSITNDLLLAIVEDNFDFGHCRELLASCKAHAKSGRTAKASITLQNLDGIKTCAIATLSLISDWMPGGIEINLQQCGAEVEKIFGSTMLDQYFHNNRPLLGAVCDPCLENNSAKPSKNCAHHNIRALLNHD